MIAIVTPTAVVVIQAATVIATIVAVVMTVTEIGIHMAATAVVVTGATVIVVARLHAGVTRQIMVGAAAGVFHAALPGVAVPPEVVEAAATLMLPRHQPLQQAIDGEQPSSHGPKSTRFK